MKLKWFFSTLIVILTVFGVCQEQSVAPNQEIVLNFSNTTTSKNHSNDVISIVKAQLQRAGANNIQVTEDTEGRLKIAYFSNKDVSTIKETLALEPLETLALSSIDDDNPNKTPLENSPNLYNLDVFEIQNNSDSHSGFGGKYIVEHKQELDRSSNPNLQPYSVEVDNKYNCYGVKSALKANSIIAIAIDNTSYNIPEVRAGPMA